MSLRSKTADEHSHPNFDQLLWQSARRGDRARGQSPLSMSLRSNTADELGSGKNPSAPESVGSARKPAPPPITVVE